DALVVDEAYQADSARYFAVGALAPRHLLVGDSGQINPFSTIAEPQRWRGLPEDPLQTAVGVLLRNHRTTPLHRLPITRRLDERAACLAQRFYPDLPFRAAILRGGRALSLSRATATDPRRRRIDCALDRAAREEWAYLEQPCVPVLQADPATIDL